MATSYLLGLGYQILERNWRCKIGEIDIIANDHDVLVFVEVKTRTGRLQFGTAFESVDWRKQNKIRKVAQLYLITHKYYRRECRFDVIAVYPESSPPIEHLIAAF